LRLRLLRDNLSRSRQAFVEFDLESIFDGRLFDDFALLWLLCHQSRVESETPETCWLEKWTQSKYAHGDAALETLRNNVRKAVETLGQGFLDGPNVDLKDKLNTDQLCGQDYFRQLLGLVFRLLLLFTAEDRELLHVRGVSPEIKRRYAYGFSASRLRNSSNQILGSKRHNLDRCCFDQYDLYKSFKLLTSCLGSEEGCPELGLPALGSFLWSGEAMPDLAEAELSDGFFLAAVEELAFTENEGRRIPIDFKNVGAREFGSVYESLLELHPEIGVSSERFTLKTASGHERKTTGSYYTPVELIDSLLDSVLEPIIAEASAKQDPQEALLSLKICDPACGSGHFLISAANRVAKRLARLRSDGEEPSFEAVGKAMREVISRCIYGVDINPMAVELCKVSLWLEASEPGKPSSYLDRRIVCGDSLIGATRELIQNGLPDKAFDCLDGDEKIACKKLKKLNKIFRENDQNQLLLGCANPISNQNKLETGSKRQDRLPSENIDGPQADESGVFDLSLHSERVNETLMADSWCAAFFIKKTFLNVQNPDSTTSKELLGITQREMKDLAEGKPLKSILLKEVEKLASKHRFFHWHLAFPEVFASGGFDVMIGNPPWEKIKLQEKEWFSRRSPDIACNQRASSRKKNIEKLKSANKRLHAGYLEALEQSKGKSRFIRSSSLYPLCGRGDVNVYSIFAEAMRRLIKPQGLMGAIVPTGIATDDTTKFFFQDLVKSQTLVSLLDFENKGIFPSVHDSYKFCLLTCGPQNATKKIPNPKFGFFISNFELLHDESRFVTISAQDIELLNPNTKTCPIFRTNKDYILIKAIYRRVPVFISTTNEKQERNPWKVHLCSMFHMTDHSYLFETKSDLENKRFILDNNIYKKGGKEYLPLYEGKMLHNFDHRWAIFEGNKFRDVFQGEKQNRSFLAKGQYWVDKNLATRQFKERKYDKNWIFALRNTTNNTNETTVVGSICPNYAFSNSLHLLLSFNDDFGKYLPVLLTSFASNYVCKNKIGGVNLNKFIIEQLAVLDPEIFNDFCPWDKEKTVRSWFLPRILELAYTACDLAPFAKDCGFDGPPFHWDEERRFLLRCELEAAIFHLYLPSNLDGRWKSAEGESPTEFEALADIFPTPRQAIDYIMESFTILKSKDMKTYGEFRTKNVILDIHDRLQASELSGVPYRSRLTPGPVEISCRQ
jgi:hypothetical protein